MVAFSGNKWAFINTVILMLLIGCSGTRPNNSLDSADSGNYTDVETLKSIINEQGKKISFIESELVNYQNMINDQSNVLDIYDDNNQNVREFRRNLEREVQSAIEQIQDGSFEKEMANTLIKMQNKIHILEDRTFYTDSLYFELVNDIVMIENEIASLIASFKEMSEISGSKKTRVIPKITNEEYQAKYIESLSNYQNGEWNLSLDGFKFLIQADSNHELADNCQYWIGEVYYGLKNYKQSIKEFEKVFLFKDTNKGDDSQYKLGLCFINIGNKNRAKEQFQKLLEIYPNSEYYQKSKQYLKQL